MATAAQMETQVEDVLVTGTYSPQPVLTSSISILDAEQIKSLNKRSLADLLKILPGVLVEEQGGPGGLTAISIRGGESNFTLVLLDGVRVNDPTNFRGGGFDFANLSAALIDRIEVVRGPQSSIYGSDALAGVINIITRRPEAGHTQSLNVEIGEDNFYNASLSAQGRTESFDYTLAVATRDDGDAVAGSVRMSDSATLRFGWQPREDHDFTASYRYLDGARTSYPEQSGGPGYALTDDLDESSYNEQVAALIWQAQFMRNWGSRLSTSRFRHTEDYHSPGIPPFMEIPPNAAVTEFTRDEVKWVNMFQTGQAHELILGAEFRHESGNSEGYVDFGFPLPTDFKLDRNTTSIFAGINANYMDGLLLQGSVRYDNADNFDSETSWRAGAKYDFNSGLTLFGNWGEAYKLPSFFALGHALVGNPDLKPEKADSWDAGAIWVRGEWHLEATHFYNDFEDLIDFDDESFRNVNRQNVVTSGVELMASWQMLRGLMLQAQGTYTDIDVKGEDTVLTGRPEWTASVVAEWRLTDDWDMALHYQYTGKQWAASRHTGEEITQELDDYHRVDWVLRWLPLSFLQLQFSVDNLLNENYQTSVGFFAPQRSIRFGVNYIH